MRPTINIPATALVVLVGPAGSGKSTFARNHFLDSAIVSSDRCRALVADDESDQSASADAFILLRTILRLRLRRGVLTIVDSTAVRRQDRRSLLSLGRLMRVPVIAVLFDVDEATCKQHNGLRQRRVADAVIEQQRADFLATLSTIGAEGFDAVHVLRDPRQESIEVNGRLRSSRVDPTGAG